MDKIIQIVSIYAVLIPLIVGLIFFSKQDFVAKIIFVLLFIASIPQLAALFSSKSMIWSLYNLYVFIDLLAWSFIFYFSIQKETRWLIVVFFSMFVSIYFYLTFTEGISKRFFSELVCLSSLIQVLWVSIYFYQLYKSDTLFKIEGQPIFWFCMAILIYAPSSYFLFAFRSYLDANASLAYLWSIHGVLNTLYYVLIAVGFFVSKKNLKSPNKLTWNQNISY